MIPFGAFWAICVTERGETDVSRTFAVRALVVVLAVIDCGGSVSTGDAIGRLHRPRRQPGPAGATYQASHPVVDTVCKTGGVVINTCVARMSVVPAFIDGALVVSEAAPTAPGYSGGAMRNGIRVHTGEHCNHRRQIYYGSPFGRALGTAQA